MTDLKFINNFRVRKPVPSANVPERYCSEDDLGFNGMFRVPYAGRMLRIIASDGRGWEHVSVSIERDQRCPTWEIMCQVKNWFWNEDEVVIQYHPAKADYVNNHPGCLHLWRPTDAVMPVPDAILVGIKGREAAV